MPTLYILQADESIFPFLFNFFPILFQIDMNICGF